MNINIQGKSAEITNELKAYAKEKFSRLERFQLSSLHSVEIILKSESRKFHCESILHISNKNPIVIEVACDSGNEAVDACIDKCERQIKRQKEKVETKRRRSSVRIKNSAPSTPE